MISDRKHHRLNATLTGDIYPDRVISQADRVQLGGGWRGYFEFGAVSCVLMAIPTINMKLNSKPTVNVTLGSKP